jgi:uncharacterized protein
MPRPIIKRRIRFDPDVTYFKPRGIKLRDLEEVILTLDELEALRLKNLENLDQKQCAEKMEISQSTFHRLLLEAGKKVTDALVNGKAIKVEGGNYRRK